jgi:GAF domain-containing protein/anti-sigma regulatory factor (Ser/Thr protein kinase)
VTLPPDAEVLAQLEDLRDPMLSRMPFEPMLDELLTRLRTALGADTATLLFLDAEESVLQPVATQGASLELMRDYRIPLGQGFAGRVAAGRAPVLVEDIATIDVVGNALPAAGVRSLLGVPLVVEDRVIGVAHVGWRTPRRFGEGDVRLLMAAGERAAWAIDHGLLLDSERTARSAAEATAERLRRLQAVSVDLAGELSLEAVTRTVVERGLSALGAVAGGIWVLAPDGTRLELQAAIGYPDEVVARWADMPLDVPAPAADAARTLQWVVLRGVQERDLRYPRLAGRAWVGDLFVTVPLLAEDRLLGVLGASFAQIDALDEPDALAFLEAAASQCAAALHRAVIVEAQRRSLQAAELAARRLAALQRATALLADLHEPAALAEVVAHEAGGEVGATRGILFGLDPAGETLRLVRSFGLPDGFADRFAELPLDSAWPAADAILRRVAVVLRDASDARARYPAVADLDWERQGLVCLPLFVGDRAIGALTLTMPAGVELDVGELGFLQSLADQCAHALDRSRLLAVERGVRSRLELLAEAGRLFAAPLDLLSTATDTCRLLVRRIADAATVHLVEPDGQVELVTVQAGDPDWAARARPLAEDLPRAARDVLLAVADTGEPGLRSPLLPEHLTTFGDADEVLVATSLDIRSGIVVPLRARGRAIGVLTVVTVGEHPLLGPDDVDTMAELAGRLALALDNARLFRQQSHIAHTLQRSLLPAVLPDVPGADVAVRYLAGTEGVNVGGDFYDVIPLPSGRIGLVVGDVMGRGIRAAAVMGQIRAAVRSYTLEGHPPAALLTRLDRLVGTLDEGMLVTCLYAEWDAATSTVVCAVAGHLPPLVRLPGRAPRFVDVEPGVPLGVGASGFTEVEVVLPPGSLLLAYTDGLVEGPDLPLDEGMSRLAAAVAQSTTAMGACNAALAALRPGGSEDDPAEGGRAYDDDTALLALLTGPVGAEPSAVDDVMDRVSIEMPADAASPSRARLVVGDVLRGWGLPRLVDAATLLVSELVTNAVRHAGTGLRLDIMRLPAGVRVAVTDHAPQARAERQPVDVATEGGRGLFLVEELSDDWGTDTSDESKTVWFELGG